MFNFRVRMARREALGLVAFALCAACHFQSAAPAGLPPLPPAATLTTASSTASLATGTATAAASPAASVPIDVTKLKISSPVNGTIHVSGAPGCVVDPSVKAVWVAAIHDLLGYYRLAHVGNTYLVAITPTAIPVAADGSFADVALGDAVTPVQDKDKLYVYPRVSDSKPFGTPVVTPIP